MDGWLKVWYGISSFVLGLLLFYQVRKFMTAISVNKFQRKNNRAVTAEEKTRIEKRMSIYAAILAMTFAFFFNHYIMFRSFGKI